MKSRVLPQIKGIQRPIRANFPARRQPRLDLQIGIQIDQPAKNTTNRPGRPASCCGRIKRRRLPANHIKGIFPLNAIVGGRVFDAAGGYVTGE